MNAENLALQAGRQAGRQRNGCLTLFACCAEAGNDNTVGYCADVCTDIPFNQGKSIDQQVLDPPEVQSLPDVNVWRMLLERTSFSSVLVVRGALHTGGMSNHIALIR